MTGEFYFPQPEASVSGNLRFNFGVRSDQPIQQLFIAPVSSDESDWVALCDPDCTDLGENGNGPNQLEAWVAGLNPSNFGFKATEAQSDTFRLVVQTGSNQSFFAAASVQLRVNPVALAINELSVSDSGNTRTVTPSWRSSRDDLIYDLRYQSGTLASFDEDETTVISQVSANSTAVEIDRTDFAVLQVVGRDAGGVVATSRPVLVPAQFVGDSARRRFR